MELQDGTGTGNRAKVDGDNHLHTRAITVTGETFAAENGDGFAVAVAEGGNDTLTLATGFDGPVLYLKNNAEDHLHVQVIAFSADTAGLIWRLTVNDEPGTLANETAVTGGNTNLGSSKTPDITAYVWDEVGSSGMTGFSGGTTCKTFIAGLGIEKIEPLGAMVLPTGAALTLEADNNTGGAVEAECSVRFYFEAHT